MQEEILCSYCNSENKKPVDKQWDFINKTIYTFFCLSCKDIYQAVKYPNSVKFIVSDSCLRK